MQSALLFAVALIPLFFLPGFSFYYDVVPRLWFLLIVVAAILVFRLGWVGNVRRFSSVRQGRWLCGLLGAQAISLLASSALSTRMWLSLNGSTWRRFGMPAQIVLVLLTLLLAADVFASRGAVERFLRYTVVAGLVAAVYGIAQYFGFDPFIDPAGYHVGEGVFTIVRPPGPLGHADYFAVYLLLVLFAAVAVFPSHRMLGAAGVALAGCALVFTGTRAALLGGVVGLAVLVILLRPRVRMRHVGIAVAAVAGFGVFYLSPAGVPLRARVKWASDDARGGARFLLWRDSLRMAAEKPIAGYGPESFTAEFPRFQSIELARAYPDFHHESPHNILLDALVAQGTVGLVLLAGQIVLALMVGRVDRTRRVLTAALVALAVSQFFFAFTLATAFCLYIVIAAIVATEVTDVGAASSRISSGLMALLLLSFAVKLAITDRKLAVIRDELASGDIRVAAAEYPNVGGADLYYARAMATISARSKDPLTSLFAAQQAAAAGARAMQTSDQPANAAYTLATLSASRDQIQETETHLREAIAAAPNWFKPHWMLARVLSLQGRLEEAEKEAMLADERADLPEVKQTLKEVRERRSSSR